MHRSPPDDERDAILHLSLPVADLEQARAFYVDVLGCEPGRVRDGWLDVWFFGMQLTLQARPAEVRPVAEQGVRHFGVALAPDALDALVARLREHDVDWLAEPTEHTDPALDAKRGAKVADPSGNVIELKCYPDRDRLRGR